MALTLILLLSIIFLLLLLSMVWPPDSPWSPWWRTNKKTARAICKLASIKTNDIVYELGSGEGVFLITAAKEFGAKGVGIEIDLLRVFVSKLLIRLYGVSDKIKILRNNFFKEDLSSATVIFIYLVPKAIARLKPKLLKELKPGTKIVSYVYQTDLSLVKKDEENRLYLYKINY